MKFEIGDLVKINQENFPWFIAEGNTNCGITNSDCGIILSAAKSLNPRLKGTGVYLIHWTKRGLRFKHIEAQLAPYEDT
tara:strand:- start:9179 stop:9415 length:237 start_codon:yes stop_codon:yes gene_type:complete